MKVAFLILAHKNPSQLDQLIDRLDSSDSIFFIHIDNKVDIAPFKSGKEKNNNIVWVKREDGRWGDVGIVKATINCLLEAVNCPHEISHYVLLSGQDYPLKSITSIVNFLRENKNTSFIEHKPFPVTELNYAGYDRINAYSIHLFGQRRTAIPLSWKPMFNFKGQILNVLLLFLFFLKGKRQHPKDINPFFGSQWWILSHEAAKKTADVINKSPYFLKYHKDSLLPDELFFQSIIGSLKIGLPTNQIIENKSLHFIDWSQCSSHPKVLDLQDYEKLISSGNLFARKMEFPQSDKLIDKLNEEA